MRSLIAGLLPLLIALAGPARAAEVTTFSLENGLDVVVLEDHRAAAVANEFMNFITLDPLLKGHYPEDLSRRLRWFAPAIAGDDMQKINAPVDFVGVNNYQREFARHAALVLGFAFFTNIALTAWLTLISDPPMQSVTGLAGPAVMTLSIALSLLFWLYARRLPG